VGQQAVESERGWEGLGERKRAGERARGSDRESKGGRERERV